MSCKTGAGRADVAVQARAGLPLPCIFHLSTFFRSLQILRFAKIYPFPKCGQTVIIDGYNQVKREEEGFPENNEKKEREKTMEKMLLHENWKLRDASETEWIPGTVPGSVYQDYLNAGKMEDPYWRANEEQALELMKRDFEYRTVFDVPETMLAHDEVLLHFDGIDTVADISLNGQTLGHVDNMHRTWEYRVKEILKEKGNEAVRPDRLPRSTIFMTGMKRIR